VLVDSREEKNGSFVIQNVQPGCGAQPSLLFNVNRELFSWGKAALA
jgi:hypothetical protein